jgi:hypothetical protein
MFFKSLYDNLNGSAVQIRFKYFTKDGHILFPAIKKEIEMCKSRARPRFEPGTFRTLSPKKPYQKNENMKDQEVNATFTEQPSRHVYINVA